MFAFLLISNIFFGELSDKIPKNDSIYIESIILNANLQKYDETHCGEFLYFPVNIKKNYIRKIIKNIVIPKFGFGVNFQRPFKFYKRGNFWISFGSNHRKKRYGGVYLLVVDARNGAIVYLGHEK